MFFTAKSLLVTGLFALFLGEVNTATTTSSTTTTEKTSKTTKTPKTTKTTSLFSFTTALPSPTLSSIPSQSASPSIGPLPPTGEYRVGVVLFPGYTVLDVFGPLEALTQLGFAYYVNLTLFAETLDPVSTKPSGNWSSPAVKSTIEQKIVPTRTFYDPIPELDLLIIPGGAGVRAPYPLLNTTVDFISAAYPKTKYLLSICTGSLLTARTGILDGKRSTTNKRAWNTVIPNGPRVKWVAVARWVIDGRIWSSSGVSAGTDATLAWIASIYGDATAQNIANGMEWMGDWKNSENDQFAKLYNLSAANNTNGA